jgi:hypothetical protein
MGPAHQNEVRQKNFIEEVDLTDACLSFVAVAVLAFSRREQRSAMVAEVGGYLDFEKPSPNTTVFSVH